MNKIIGLIVLLVLSSVYSHSVMALIIGNTVQGSMFYAIDDDTDQYFLHQYDMDTGEKGQSLLLAEPPTAIASDSTNLYIAYHQKLYMVSVSDNSVTQVLLRNFVGEIKQIVVAGNYLLVLSGEPSQIVSSISKSDGTLVSRTPLSDDLFGVIDKIYFDSGDSYLYAVYTALVSESRVIASVYNSATGVFDVSNENVQDALNITDLGEAMFAEEHNLIVDSAGRVIQLGAGTLFETRSDENPIAHVDFIITDEVIQAVAGTDSIIYVSATIDNSCHAYNGGSRIRRWNDIDLNADGIAEDFSSDGAGVVVDVPEQVHTLALNGSDLFAFWGEGSSFDGGNTANITQPVVDNSIYEPLSNSFDISYDKSAVLDNGTDIVMHIDEGCEHHLVRWDTQENKYLDSVETSWEPTDFSYSKNQNRVYLAAEFTGEFYIYYVDFDDLPLERTPLGVYKGTLGKLLATDNQVIFQKNFDGLDTLHVVGDNAGTFTDGALPDCCSKWTNAAWDPELRRIIFTTASSMYEMIMTEPADTSVTVSFDAPDVSIDYGVTQVAADVGAMVFNSTGTLLYYRGAVYDTSTLNIVDSILSSPEMATWAEGDLYTMAVDGAIMEKWIFLLGEDSHTGTPVEFELVDTSASLLAIEDGADVIPFSIVLSSDKTITYREHVSESQTNTTVVGGGGDGGTGGDGGDGGTGGDTGGGSAAPLGGTGGGSIGFAYLLLLTFAFAAKRRKLS